MWFRSFPNGIITRTLWMMLWYWWRLRHHHQQESDITHPALGWTQIDMGDTETQTPVSSSGLFEGHLKEKFTKGAQELNKKGQYFGPPHPLWLYLRNLKESMKMLHSALNSEKSENLTRLHYKQAGKAWLTKVRLPGLKSVLYSHDLFFCTSAVTKKLMCS